MTEGQRKESVRKQHLKLKSFELAKGLVFYLNGKEQQQTSSRLIKDAEEIYQELIKQ